MYRSVFAALFFVFSPASAQNPIAEDRMLQSRAVEAVIWGMPAVNYDLMLQEALNAGAKENEIRLLGQAVGLAQPDTHPQPHANFYHWRGWSTAGPSH